MSAVNIPLLRKAVEWAEAEAALGEDGRWVQAFVSSEKHCGTSYCIAGWVAAQDTETGDPYDVPCGDPVRHAADRLGIPHTDDEWNPLFHADNTIKDVRHIAESLAGERL